MNDVEKEMPKFMKIFDEISDVLIRNKVNPRDSIIILSCMSESIFKKIVSDLSVTNLEEILKDVKGNGDLNE